jgi:hypothetical protein
MNHDIAVQMKTILKTSMLAAIAAILVIAAVAPSLIGDASATHLIKKKVPKISVKAKQSNIFTQDSANNDATAIQKQTVIANVKGDGNIINQDVVGCIAIQQGVNINGDNIGSSSCDT